MAESDAPISESVDGEARPDDDAPSNADKARDEQAKQEESGQENPTWAAAVLKRHRPIGPNVNLTEEIAAEVFLFEIESPGVISAGLDPSGR
jgi:hypothetical protein